MNSMFSKSINPKRTGLHVLIVSVVISASLAIFSLLRGEFSETDGNILMTAFSVAAASVLTLSNGIVLEQGRNKPLATLAIIVSVAGFGILIVTIWNSFDHEDLMKIAASTIFVGTMLTHWSLVSIARVPARFRLLQVAAFPLSGVLATFLIGAVWELSNDSQTAQITGVVGILTVATTIILPVLQRLAVAEGRTRRKVNYCPYCGKSLNVTDGSITCPECGATFRVRQV
ncbi:MAG: zinc ribbon domain-containing protein [Dehalococcoidia bacterium]|nr:zinc ribbon domain-containing protein [Dehalococcoidia bacterium]